MEDGINNVLICVMGLLSDECGFLFEFFDLLKFELCVSDTFVFVLVVLI